MAGVEEKDRDEYVPESATAVLTTQLVDENGDNIESSAVSALVATLWNHLGSVVNSRNQQSILGENGGTLSAGGLLTLTLSPTDTAAVETGGEYQQRTLTLKATHSGGKTMVSEIRFFIRKLNGHP